MSLFTALIPSALGVIGSLFGGKGKKQEYSPWQGKQQQAAYSALLKMLQQKMGGQSAGFGPTSTAMNQLGNMFYGQNMVPPQAQQQTRQASALPGIHAYARGGIVDSPQLAMVGERGPEAIVPLGQYGRQNQAGQMNMAGYGTGLQQSNPMVQLGQMGGTGLQPGNPMAQLGQQQGQLQQGMPSALLGMLSKMRRGSAPSWSPRHMSRNRTPGSFYGA